MMYGPDGRTLISKRPTGTRIWEIKGSQGRPFTTVNTAIRYVLECLGNVKRLQRGVGVFEKDRPIAFADAHSLMGELHVTALVVQRAAGSGDEKIHDELPFPFHAVRAAMLPEPAQLRVFFHAVQEIVGDSEDGIITTEAFVE